VTLLTGGVPEFQPLQSITHGQDSRYWRHCQINSNHLIQCFSVSRSSWFTRCSPHLNMFGACLLATISTRLCSSGKHQYLPLPRLWRYLYHICRTLTSYLRTLFTSSWSSIWLHANESVLGACLIFYYPKHLSKQEDLPLLIVDGFCIQDFLALIS
jgi:hypothetical protein